MISTRPSVVSGSFYPEDPTQLHTMVRAYLQGVGQISGRFPKAIIVPHAGYIYSGAIAASAYAHVACGRNTIRRVVLLGPAHRVGFHGLALSSADNYATPLGLVPLDRAVIAMAQSLPGVQILDKAHAQEHSLEVQLPFLQEVLQDFSIVPIVVGETPAEVVANVIERLWGGVETLVVISSDLSHYRDYESAKKQDYSTSQAIEELRPDAIVFHDACGRLPINGLLLVAKKLGLSVKTYDLRSSGDTAGDRERVVGYGAYGFE